MQARYVPLLLLGASFLLAVWLDFVVWPTYNTAIFFALPLALASQRARDWDCTSPKGSSRRTVAASG